MERKILVPVDGSIYGKNALHYIAGLFRGQHDIRFHLLSLVPVNEMPPDSAWLDEQELLDALEPVTRQKHADQKRFLDKAAAELIEKGIAAPRISHELKLSGPGAAADILRAARKGLYDAILVGRRGIGKLEEIFMGSVSSTLLEKCHDIPLWIVDGTVDSRKFLVPVDGTVHSLLAIDHLAFILKDNPVAEITLFHSTAMLANSPKIIPEEFYGQWGKEWCDKHLGRPDSLFHASRQLLLEAGFPEERIFWFQTMKGIDPSRQILRQSLLDDFGTIVMGRRGGNIKKGVFKGVSDRVIFMAEKAALWIVG